MPTPRLQEFLNRNRVRFESVAHIPSVTAQETAQVTHTRGKEFAKTIVVDVDGRLAMVVLPAHKKINLGRLQRAIGATHVEIADEEQFHTAFPECEIGAMPPFGNLYDMEVFVADILAEDDRIAFNAGSHTEAIRMSYEDFEKLVKPVPVRIT